jgi:hypothetical protein
MFLELRDNWIQDLKISIGTRRQNSIIIVALVFLFEGPSCATTPVHSLKYFAAVFGGHIGAGKCVKVTNGKCYIASARKCDMSRQ